MDVIPGGSARSSDYDRNPVTINNFSAPSPGAAARAYTTDWTYTVPAGKKANVTLAYARARNNSTVPLNESAFARVEITTGGVANNPCVNARICIGNAGVQAQSEIGRSCTLIAAESIRGTSQSDNNAAGTLVALESGCIIMEFDA